MNWESNPNEWNKVISLMRSHLQYYRAPLLNIASTIGILLSITFIIQVITGIILAASYSNEIEETFCRLHSFQRGDFLQSWLVHYMHISGSSVVFLLIYSHMIAKVSRARRGNTQNWTTGLIVYAIWMIAAFFGYILPWGQMSYWAATVISSLLPRKLLILFLGNYFVNNLYRIFTWHFLIPIVSIPVLWLHMFYLHQMGSVSILGYNLPLYDFSPFTLIQDMVAIKKLLWLFVITMYIDLGNPTNVLEVDSFKTPTFIEPEWYFLTYYGLLKTVPNIYVGEMSLALIFILLWRFTQRCVLQGKVQSRCKGLFWMVVGIIGKYMPGITVTGKVVVKLGELKVLNSFRK